MTHADLDVLADVLAGEASELDAAHVAGCATCSAALADLERASGLATADLAALPVPELPPLVAARIDRALVPTTVLPARPADRRTRWLPAAAGVAAVAVFVLGGVALLRGSSGSSDSADTAAVSAPEAAAGIRSSSTGSDYRKDGALLRQQLPGLLGSGAPDTAKAQATGDDGLAALHDPATLAACLASLSDPTDDSVPLALDYARFEGRPALVVVLPTAKAGKVDVFVVGPECGPSDEKVLFFTRLAT